MSETTPQPQPASPSPGNSARIDPMVGKRLASYEILSRVARGGMGVVYRARHVYIDRIVALKVLDPALAERKDLIERFRTEAQSLARVEHENVIKVIDILEEKNVHFIVMDFAEGVNLRVLVKEKGPLQPAELLSVARQSSDALYAAHKQGILHRDIKPENLILSSRGRCKLTDFGLAGDLRLIAEGHEGPLNFGTPAYAAPEVLRRMTPDPRSDIFAWGATMYHLATGEPPFGATGAQQIQLRQKQGAELLEARRPDLPRSLCALIQDAMAFHPAERPADFREVLERLPRRVHATSADTGAPTTGLLTSTVPTEPRVDATRMAGMVGALVAVGALITLAVVLWVKFGKSEEAVAFNSSNTPVVNAPINVASSNNRPVVSPPSNAGHTPTFTPEEDAFNGAELDSRDALSRADFKRAYDAWDSFVRSYPQSAMAGKARGARDEVVRRVTERRDLEFKAAETAAGKALLENRTADALAIWEKFPAELLVALFSGENDALVSRVEAQKTAVKAREADDLATVMEKSQRLRDQDKLLDERELLDGCLAGRTSATQETVRARLTQLRQLLESRHQAALDQVEAQRKRTGPLRGEAARKAALGLDAMSLEIANRRWSKVAEGLRVLVSDCKDNLVSKLLDEFGRDVALAAKAERALPDALERQQRRGGEFEFKMHASISEDGTRSGTLETYNGRVTSVKPAEFTIAEAGGAARNLKTALLHASTVRALLKEGSLEERAALVAWLFSQGKAADARTELTRLMKLAGVSDAVAAQLSQMDSGGQLGSMSMRLLRFFAARENDALATDFLRVHDAGHAESRLLAAGLALKQSGENARAYLDAAAAVSERDLLSPVLYAAAVLAPDARLEELKRWVEIESWIPPGKTVREPYNPEALVRLAQRLAGAGFAAEARKQAAAALALDASNETAWRMLK
ncbi:MAG: serine/threonine protein kinase [Planctomycetes bacterium]|nr:serine/threonine protein kinase [Planctomycetota bacterium]